MVLGKKSVECLIRVAWEGESNAHFVIHGFSVDAGEGRMVSEGHDTVFANVYLGHELAAPDSTRT